MIKSTILKQLGKLVFKFTSRLVHKTLLDEGKNRFFTCLEHRFPYLLVFLFATKSLFAQTIEEKKKSYQMEKEGNELGVFLYQLNQKLKILRQQLQSRYERVNLLFEKEEKEEEYHTLLKEVKGLRSEISLLENKWHDLAVEETKREDEGYAIWDQEETTLSQLIMEYGSNDYLYVVPPEILSMKLHMHSNIPIPRESWSSLLEIILSHNGIGIKQLNPYARQLYVLKQDLIAVDTILNNQKALSDLPPKSRVAYIFSPPPERLKGVSQFFERFRDPKMTFIYQVGIKIAMISSKEEVEKLLTLYEAVWEKENEKVTRVFTMHRLAPEEMEKIVKAYFEQADKKRGGGLTRGEGEELSIFPLKEERSLVVIGPKDMVDRAEKLIGETERQIEDPKAMTVFWYTCRHSDPLEVAEVLEKVYASLLYSGVEGERPNPEAHPLPPTRSEKPAPDGKFNPPNYGPPPYSSVVNPPVAVAGTIESQKKEQRSYTTNFIPYPKTGSIMMVIQRDILEKIKELLKKIDVPKKMVQIEVLLFEKRVSHQNNFGLSFLKLGAAASNTHKTGFSYSSELKEGKMGIVDFFLFRTKPNAFWPAYDIAYNFLMSQEDVRINASPSVTTLNQTPATIAIVDEISIDNGAAPINSNVGTVFQKSFSRAQYGTTIVVTPTVHEKEGIEEEVHFVTLETDISFDTIRNKSERPEVNRRHIENQVRVMDGETVILGGLRRKSAEDRSSKLPFLGELPGIGKLFGESKMDDQQIELFIFITPHIIFDKKGDFAKVRYELLKQRPGDIPEFLEKINEAKKRKKERLFDNSLKLLFGKVNE